MSSPLDFLHLFRDLLRERGLRFAITSGMACVRYGLQQNTKDSDWIIAVRDVDGLRQVLESRQAGMPPWQVSYRPIFGAPLDPRFLAGGWTSHLLVKDRADSPEHHLDFFGKPPRVSAWELDAEDPSYASRDTVARMKKTDRDKDWPIVDGLGYQTWLHGDPNGLLHLRSVERLREAWRACDPSLRESLAERRPLLRLVERSTDVQVEGWLLVERTIWESVNRVRHRIYQSAWKEFYRSWQRQQEWSWPSSAPFWMQHRQLLDAAARHGLPAAPLDGISREEILSQGIGRAADLLGRPLDVIVAVQPPLTELLP